MKKVGVVTLTSGSNYGNKLQHYAVIKLLSNLGYQPETVIDKTNFGFTIGKGEKKLKKFKPSYIYQVINSRLQYKYHKKNESDGYLKCIIRERRLHNKFVELEKERQRVFDKFTHDYLPFTNWSINAEYMRYDTEKDYVAFLVGSDQVWNPCYRDMSDVRFLQFAPPYKRIAISPSFGVSEIPGNLTEKYKEKLNGFASISVRETSGQKIIEDLTGKKVSVLIDPTLMFSAEEWDIISRKPKNFNEKEYILTYFLGGKSKKTENAISNMAKTENVKVVNLFEITDSNSYVYGPSEFLWLIKNAKFVWTDSFHGTVFSIIYNKAFRTLARSENGFSSDSRVLNLLEKLGIETDSTGRTLSYNKLAVQKKLKSEQMLFVEYIKKALTDAEKAATQCANNKVCSVADINALRPDHCTGCSACESVCPVNAIAMHKDEEGFLYPKINMEKCILCKKCVAVCESAQCSFNDTIPKGYVAENKNAEMVKYSSSGGIFSILSDVIIKENGVVYGAAFDKNLHLRHFGATTHEECASMRGSKYFQSDCRWIYSKVKTSLDSNKMVLFTGTPCQVAGLKAFLGREYINLFSVDVICHGVPSEDAFLSYINQIAPVNNVEKVCFRNKEKGWKHFSMHIETSGNLQYIKDLYHDAFLRSFLSNINLRKSCYNCPYKKYGHSADITLGDFWGAAHVIPDIDNDTGLSLVLVHTKKGEDFLQKINGECNIMPVDVEAAIVQNSAMLHSVKIPVGRGDFYKMVRKHGYKETVDTLVPITVRHRIGFIKEKIYKIMLAWHR